MICDLAHRDSKEDCGIDMYLEVNRRCTAAQDKSEVVVSAQLEPFESCGRPVVSVLSLSASESICYTCLLCFFGSFSELPSLDSRGSSSTQLSPDLFSDMAFQICRSTSCLLFSPSDIITMIPALGDSVLSIICISIKSQTALGLTECSSTHACRLRQAR